MIKSVLVTANSVDAYDFNNALAGIRNTYIRY